MNAETTLREKLSTKEGRIALLSKWADKLFPYAMIFVVSMMAFYLWVSSDVISGGDDIEVHLNMIGDLVYGFRNGFFDSSGHTIFGIFSYNPYLFYGHLPHLVAAALVYCFSGMGLGVLGSIKIVAISSVFLSGVFSYLLAMRVTKRGRGMSLAFAILYVLMPYRLFCFYYRFAFSEAVALAFPPLLFYGLYGILHDEEPKIAPYVVTVIGCAGLLLSHPFTALIFGVAAVVYLIISAKRVWNVLKCLRKDIYIGISLLLIVFLVYRFVIPMIEVSSSGIYRMSDSDVMWTTLSQILSRFGQSNLFSGILNIVWVGSYGGTPPDTQFLWALGAALYPSLGVVAIVADYYLEKKLEKNLVSLISRALVAALILFAPLLFASSRPETYLGMIAFYVCFLFYRVLYPLLKLEEDPIKRGEKKEFEDVLKGYLKTPEIYFSVFTIIIAFLYIYVAWIWEISPSVLYMGQFPFRFWGLAYFGIFLLLLFIMAPFKNNRIAVTGSLLLATFFLPLCQGLADKRIYNYTAGNSLYEEPDMDYYRNYRHWGTADEYLPQDLYDIGDPGNEKKSEYSNSLASKIGFYFVYNRVMPYAIEDYIDPVFLEGSGTAEITYLKTPEATFDVVSYSDGLMQIPQIYYPGYQAVITYEDGSTENLEIENVDGLVAVRVPEGTYEVAFTYPGTLNKQVGRWLFPVGVAGLIAFGAYGTWYTRKGRKKEETPDAESDLVPTKPE